MRCAGSFCVCTPSALFLTLAAISNVAAATPVPAGNSLQQQFDTASAAQANQDCLTAIPIFERLARDPGVKPGTAPAGMIALRLGICLAERSRYDEAEKQLLSGLPIVRQQGSQLAVDQSQGEEALGDIYDHRRDHDAAVNHYKKALDLLPEGDRFVLYTKLAKETQFDGGAEALGYIDQAQKEIEARSKPDRSWLAATYTIRGRILMNQGQNKAALAALRRALELSGGLTDKVTLGEVSMRGDLAEAALLNGDKEAARLYLAYTGAGRIESSPFAIAASMSPPQCGPETGLSPKDVAIVEFGIDEAGDVPMARTVYTRGNYAVAAEFGRAVEKWFWYPSDLAKIPPFFKALTRVELRCSMSPDERASIIKPLKDRFTHWASPYLDGLDLDNTKVGIGLEKLTKLADRWQSEGKTSGVVAALTARAILSPGTRPTVVDDFKKARTIASSAHLPHEIYDSILVFDDISEAAQETYAHQSFDRVITTLTRDQQVTADDAIADDTLSLVEASASEDHRADAITALSRVANDARLPEHDPLRQVALLRLANMSAIEGKFEDAQHYFGLTGLSEEQCSLIGVAPSMRSSGTSSGNFPLEAMRYGFEGWVDMEFDINANGTTANARPIIAYPPFVFVDAATDAARGFRYHASYRPTNAIACSSHRQSLIFRLATH